MENEKKLRKGGDPWSRPVIARKSNVLDPANSKPYRQGRRLILENAGLRLIKKERAREGTQLNLVPDGLESSFEGKKPRRTDESREGSTKGVLVS